MALGISGGRRQRVDGNNDDDADRGDEESGGEGPEEVTHACEDSVAVDLASQNDGADDAVVGDKRETDTIVVRDDKVQELSVRDNDDRCDEGVRCLDATYRYFEPDKPCLLYTSPSPRDLSTSRMPSSA